MMLRMADVLTCTLVLVNGRRLFSCFDHKSEIGKTLTLNDLILSEMLSFIVERLLHNHWLTTLRPILRNISQKMKSTSVLNEYKEEQLILLEILVIMCDCSCV